MKRLMLIALTALICNVAFAQIRVTGKVTSSQDGSPVPFASVVVNGTMQGIATLDDGTYILEGVPSNATLVFSSIGFVDLEVPVNGRNLVNAILTPDTEALEEVMVVAYGTVKKGSYSGSATVVSQESVKDAPIVSFEQVLAGKAPGVQAVSVSGQPGADSQIRIRGYGSFNAGNAPLYVIDGVPATSGNWSSGNASSSVMNFLNPSDIESFTILKDAAAASLYGSRASNGVILITTKRGKTGKLTSTFKLSTGFSYFAYNHLPLATDEQTEKLHREAWTNYGNASPSRWASYGSLDAYVNAKVAENYPAKDESKYIYKDWEDVIFRTGIIQNYEYSIAGGSDKSKIYASVGYTDQQGVVVVSYLKRLSTTINAESQISKWLKIGGNLQYSWQYQQGHQEGYVTKANPIFMWKIPLSERWPYAYKEDGSLYLERWNPSMSTVNPLGSWGKEYNDYNLNRLLLKAYAEVKFTDWLKAKTIISNDWTNQRDRFAWYYGHPNFYAYSDIGGYISDRNRNISRLVSSTTVNFDKTWGKHHFGAMVGWEAEQETYFYLGLAKMDFSHLGATESILATGFDNGRSYSQADALLSALSSINYDYDGKYYLTGTYRRDGSSRLSKETRWGDFWSISGSWRFSNEDWLKADWLNDAKLRASYGTSGTLPSNYYGYMAVYDYTSYGDVGASYPANLANSDLSWEKNTNWNIAIDATIFDRYTFTAEYYNKLTTDLLLDASVPTTTGFSSTLTNIGSMVNRGWELSVNVDILKTQDWDVSVGANWSYLHNEVLSLSEEGESIVSTPQIWKKGYNFYQFYTRNYLGVCPEDSYMGNTLLKAGYPMYAEGSFFEKGATVNKTVVLKDGTKIEKGGTMPYDSYNYYPTNRNNASSMILDGITAIPKGFGGFNASVRWKDLSLSMSWAYRYGSYIWNEATEQISNDGYYTFHRNIAAQQVDTWSPSNPNGTQPLRIVGNNQGGYYYSSRYIESGDFLRMKDLTLSYSIPRTILNKIKMTSARVYVSGTNLITFAKSTIDPEVTVNGYYYYDMPALRSVSFGLEVSF